MTFIFNRVDQWLHGFTAGDLMAMGRMCKVAIIATTLFCVLYFRVHYLINRVDQSFTVPELKIKAPPYNWPAGCQRHDYVHQYHDGIDRECAVKEYEFVDYRKYNLTNYKNAKYYRVGDGIVQINCGFLRKCSISNRYPLMIF